jgi:malate dehydrogenase (oxaloacetate-decarboxylating)(NADP+)
VLRRQLRALQPAQANNAYIFPAVGHAAVLTKCSRIPNEMFLVAAEALACMTSVDELAHGYLFPPFNQVRTAFVKTAVCTHTIPLTVFSTCTNNHQVFLPLDASHRPQPALHACLHTSITPLTQGYASVSCRRSALCLPS